MSKQKSRIIKAFMIVLTILFVAVVGRELAMEIKYAPDYSSRYGTVLEYAKDRTNIIPGKTYSAYGAAWMTGRINRDLIYRFFAGNFLFGIPLGIILPFFFSKFRTWKGICGIGLAVLLVKEVLQVGFMIGSFDIDGILLSFLGMICGYLLVKKMLFKQMEGTPARAQHLEMGISK